MNMGKRGISAIVATVLIVLVTVVAVAVIWTFVVPVINDGGMDFSSEDVDLQIVSNAGYTYYDSEDEVLSVHVKRSGDSEGDSFFRVIIGFDDGNSQTMPNILEAPEKGSLEVYPIGLRGYDFGTPVSVDLVSVAESEASITASVISELLESMISEVYSSSLRFARSNCDNGGARCKNGMRLRCVSNVLMQLATLFNFTIMLTIRESRSSLGAVRKYSS